jgi:prepilin-type N-terminal cleavage/methylation domain-containing protein
MKRGFTLIELLVVIAIIAILAAILFPVFAQARLQANKTADISNFNQTGKATEMYKDDNSLGFPPSSYTVGKWFPPDKAWPTSTQGYTRNWGIYVSPGDPNKNRDLTIDGKPCGPTDTACKEYGRGTRADVGISLQYIAPMYTINGRSLSIPIKANRLQTPAKVLVFLNSIWDRDYPSGTPEGGGIWVVDPPCRVTVDNIDTFPPFPPGTNAFWWLGAWNPGQPKASNVFGAVWPWHGETAIVTFADTHVKALRIPQISAGCDVKDQWRGRIYDRDAYLWDWQ